MKVKPPKTIWAIFKRSGYPLDFVCVRKPESDSWLMRSGYTAKRYRIDAGNESKKVRSELARALTEEGNKNGQGRLGDIL